MLSRLHCEMLGSNNLIHWDNGSLTGPDLFLFNLTLFWADTLLKRKGGAALKGACPPEEEFNFFFIPGYRFVQQDLLVDTL